MRVSSGGHCFELVPLLSEQIVSVNTNKGWVFGPYYNRCYRIWVLSILYIIYMKYLGKVIIQFGVSCHRYVDDKGDAEDILNTVFGGSKGLDGMKPI